MPRNMTAVEVVEIHPHEASDAELAALAEMRLAWYNEVLPGDPHPTGANLVREMRAPYAVGIDQRWVLATRNGAPVGFGLWDLDHINNPQQLWFDAFVLPAERRNGIGLALARRVHTGAMGLYTPTETGFQIAAHIEVGKSLISLVEDIWGIPAATVERTARLVLADADRDALLADLEARLPRQTPNYAFHTFEMDELPEGVNLADYLAMAEEVNNLMPLEGLTLKPNRLTEEMYHSRVERQRSRGHTMWTYLVTDRATGTPVGYTLLNFNPKDTRLLHQWGTGVRKASQGHGLGKTLKLLMLRRIFTELPEALYIDTGNAASNAAMIGINTALGFKEHFRYNGYQLPITRFLELLDSVE